jgi:hypothetical protein
VVRLTAHQCSRTCCLEWGEEFLLTYCCPLKDSVSMRCSRTIDSELGNFLLAPRWGANPLLRPLSSWDHYKQQLKWNFPPTWRCFRARYGMGVPRWWLSSHCDHICVGTVRNPAVLWAKILHTTPEAVLSCAIEAHIYTKTEPQHQHHQYSWAETK